MMDKNIIVGGVGGGESEEEEGEDLDEGLGHMVMSADGDGDHLEEDDSHGGGDYSLQIDLDNVYHHETEENESVDPDMDLIRVKMEVDCDNYSSSSQPTATATATSTTATIRPRPTKEEIRQGDLDYLNLLEKDHQQLSTLLILKEREWDAILKLKKLKEIKIARLKRRREVEEGLGWRRRRRISQNGGDVDVDDKTLKNNNIADAERSVGMGNKREVDVRNSIRRLEVEVGDLVKEVFAEGEGNSTFDSQFDGLETFSQRGRQEEVEDGGAFLASNALKSLVSSRNKSPSMGGFAAKIVGEGRQGPKVEVSTLITDYRLKTQKRSRSTTPTPTLPLMNQSTGISFTDLLSKIKCHYEKEQQDLQTSPSTNNTVNNTKTVVQASKVRGTASSGNNSVSAATTTKAATGTTLAKLLSSNNGNSVSRSLDDVYNHKSNFSAGSEKNLSLANLLASSKSRNEPPKKRFDVTNAPVCQGCHANTAQFVCAGCANQWYCSRECQVAVWDEHAELCSG